MLQKTCLPLQPFSLRFKGTDGSLLHPTSHSQLREEQGGTVRATCNPHGASSVTASDGDQPPVPTCRLQEPPRPLHQVLVVPPQAAAPSTGGGQGNPQAPPQFSQHTQGKRSPGKPDLLLPSSPPPPLSPHQQECPSAPPGTSSPPLLALSASLHRGEREGSRSQTPRGTGRASHKKGEKASNWPGRQGERRGLEGRKKAAADPHEPQKGLQAVQALRQESPAG